MRLRILVIGFLSVCLISCMESNPSSRNDHAQGQESTVDFHKAALLNVEMGEAYLAQGQVPRAKQKFIHALELKPKLPEAHTSIGYFYEKVGDLVEAEHHYKQAISYGNGKGRFYNNYGTFLCRQARFKEADKAFNNAIKDKQYIKTAEVYENAGLCCLKEKNLEKAQVYFQTAAMRDPSRSIASLELATIEFERQNYAVAKEYLENFKTISEPNPRSLLLGIKLNTILGDKHQLASETLKLRNMFPDSPQYKQYLESTRHE